VANETQTQQTATTGVAPVPGQEPVTSTPQPQGAQEGEGVANPWEQIRQVFTPEEVVAALRTQERMAEIGDVDAYVQKRAVETAKNLIEKMRADPKGRQSMLEWLGAGAAAPQEEDLTPEAREIRALRTKLQELEGRVEQTGKLSEEAQTQASSMQDLMRWQVEMREFYREHPDAREDHEDMWSDLLDAIRMNPRLGKPGDVKAMAAQWQKRAQATHERRLKRGSKQVPLSGPGSGGAVVLPKKAEDLSKDEAMQETMRILGLG